MNVSWPECAGCKHNIDIDWRTGTCPEKGTNECVQQKKLMNGTHQNYRQSMSELPKRPKMLPNPAPYYWFDFSLIPDQIRVSFEDGTTAIYDLRCEQPHPVIVQNIKLIRKMKQGYVNKPRRRRKG